MKLYLCKNTKGATKIMSLKKIIEAKRKGNYYVIIKEIKDDSIQKQKEKRS